MSKFFNPLKASAKPAMHAGIATAGSEDKPFEATAALTNNIQGECPKCKTGMEMAIMAGNIPVHYCEKCRVATPTAD